MPDTVPNLAETVLEVVSPDGARRYVRVTQMPFLIGRGAETGNHLQLADRRISRNCAAIVTEASKYYIEDRGQRRGLFVNGEKVESRELQDGDAITFGLDDSYEIIYRSAANASTDSLPHLLTRIEHITSSEPSGRRSSQTQSSLGSHHAAAFAASARFGSRHHARSRCLRHRRRSRSACWKSILRRTLKVRLARRSGGMRLPPESLSPSQTAIQLALRSQSAVITEDLAQADMDLQAAQSIVAQRLRAVVVIPLYAMSRANTDQSMINIKRGDFLGVLYLDSRRPAAFSKLDRQILDALAADAASILDNARLVERERERQRMEQEIGIARDIQQALLAEKFSGLSASRPSAASTSPALRWAATTLTFFLSATIAPRSCSLTFPAKDSARHSARTCCRARSPA